MCGVCPGGRSAVPLCAAGHNECSPPALNWTHQPGQLDPSTINNRKNLSKSIAIIVDSLRVSKIWSKLTHKVRAIGLGKRVSAERISEARLGYSAIRASSLARGQRAEAFFDCLYIPAATVVAGTLPLSLRWTIAWGSQTNRKMIAIYLLLAVLAAVR